MDYRVIVTTDGRPGLLERTLESFFVRVSPRPAELLIFDDSGDENYRRYLDDICSTLASNFPVRFAVFAHRKRLGFCKTVKDAWVQASLPGADWVYWLEDDFLHTRGVDLRDLAFILEREPNLAQLALYRNPVSPEEKAAGGYMNLRPETYSRRGDGSSIWWEHQNFWTTNVSLFRRQTAVDFDWPTEPRCEGLLGLTMLERRPETIFGIWGDGSPWTEHVGQRAGTGY